MFTWRKRDDDADFVVGTEESLWSEYFAREKDRCCSTAMKFELMIANMER